MIKYQNKIPVIILDCEERSQEGLIPSYGQKGIPIIAISSNGKCPAFKSRYISKHFVIPHISNGVSQYISAIVNLPFRGVLVYSHDMNAMVLSKYQDILKNSGFMINIPTLPDMLKVFDKWESYRHIKSLNINCAKTKIIDTVEQIEMCWEEFQKPVILKGTRLAGGNYQKLYDKKDLEISYARIKDEISKENNRLRDSKVILQEWLEYDITDQWCCETVYDQKSTPIGFLTIKKIRSSLNNNGSYTSRLYAGEYKGSLELENMTRKILSSVNWKGFAHVEYFYVPKEKKFYFTEVNPRLPGFSYYPFRAGFDMGYYYYADLVGMPYNIPLSFPKSVYFETFRYPGDLSDGMLNIFKGYIDLFPFLKSYLKLFNRNLIKVIDPIRYDDPKYTFYSLLDNVRRFSIKIIKYIGKIIGLKSKDNIPVKVRRYR